jgi:hypothetical protein
MSRLRTIHNPLSDDIAPLDSQVVISEDPLPKIGSHSWLICGKPGTGKSTLLLGALTSKKSNWYAKKSFDNLFLCSPSARRDPKFDNMVAELSSEGHYWDTFNERILNEILDEVDEYNDEYRHDMEEWEKSKETSPEQPYYTREIGKRRDGKLIIKKIYVERELPRHCLILDDVVNLLPKSTQTSKINDLYCNHRHKKLCIITVSQVYNKLNPIIRRGSNMMSVFHTDNKKEYEAIENDLAVDNDMFKRVYDFATDKMNSFLHVQLCGARPLYFKKFDKIVSDEIPK